MVPQHNEKKKNLIWGLEGNEVINVKAKGK
jgi:hypothetical protein